MGNLSDLDILELQDLSPSAKPKPARRPLHRCPVCVTDVAELREGVCLDCFKSTGRP
jgi:hypothetical protein